MALLDGPASWYMMSAAPAVFYSGGMLMVRKSADAGAPISVITWSRFAFLAFATFCYMIAQHIQLLPNASGDRVKLLVTSILCTVVCLAYIPVCALAPLGDAIAIYSTASICTLLIARVWLEESIGIAGLPAVLFSSTGVLLITRSGGAEVTPEASFFVTLGYTLAIVAAFAQSLVFVMQTSAKDSFHTVQLLFLWSAIGTVGVTPWLLQVSLRELPWPQVLPPLAVSNVLSATAVVFLTKGNMCSGCTAGITSRLYSSEVMWSYLFQVILLHQPTSYHTLGGAGMILLSIIGPVAEHEWRSRQAADDTTAGEVRDLIENDAEEHMCSPAT